MRNTTNHVSITHVPIATMNPFTNKTIKSFTQDTAKQVKTALATANAEFAPEIGGTR